MPYVEGLASARGGRDETEALVREALSKPPAPGSQREFVHLKIADLRELAHEVEEVSDDAV